MAKFEIVIEIDNPLVTTQGLEFWLTQIGTPIEVRSIDY